MILRRILYLKSLLKEVCRDSINGLKDYFIASQIYPKLEMDENIYVFRF